MKERKRRSSGWERRITEGIAQVMWLRLKVKVSSALCNNEESKKKMKKSEFCDDS